MWLLVVAAALPLVIGRGARLRWAARLWVTACASWGLAFATTRGDLGSFAPSESVVLAPAALAIAACVGLGIAAFENDLTGREFGWRQVVSVSALVFVALGLLPVARGAAGGRWDLPAQGVEQPLAFLGRPSTDGVGRVLWLGDPRAIPAGGWSVQPGLSFALTPQALPDSAQVFTPAGPGPASLVADAVRLAVSGGTVHLGRLLAPAGVRYVVVLDGLAPSMVGSAPPSVSAPPPAGLNRDLLQQDDLQVVPGVLGVQVFAERRPHAGDGGAGDAAPAGADVVLPGGGGRGGLAARAHRPGERRTGRPAPVSAGTVYAGYAPAGSFALSVNGRAVPQRPAFGWAAQYPAARGDGVAVPLAIPLVPLAVMLEVAAWVAAGRGDPRTAAPARARRAAGSAAGTS